VVGCDSVWPAMKRVILIILGVILGCVLGFCSFVSVTYWMGTITIDASQISIFPLVVFLAISMSVLFGSLVAARLTKPKPPSAPPVKWRSFE